MLDFLSHILPASGVYFAIIKNKSGFLHIGCETLEKLAKVIADADANGYEVYHACAAYKEKHVLIRSTKHNKEIKAYRIKQNVRSVKSFWIDIDAGENKPYETVEEAVKNLVDFLRKTKLPAPTIVASGRGLHVYYVMKHEMPVAVWEQIALAFKKKIDAFGLKADQIRTADVCSILRPVGTYNKKDISNKLPVKLLNKAPAISNEDFIKIIGIEQPKAAKEADTSLIDNILAGRNYPPISAEKIADKCQQIAHCRNTHGNVSEPLWYAMLGILAYCENANHYAHAWSSGHPNYSYAETEAKLAQWKNAATGPATCEIYEKINSSGCVGCVYKNTIKSPAQLGHIVKKLDTPKKQIPDPPYPYLRTPQGLMVKQKDQEAGHIFFDYDLYISDILSNGNEGDKIVIEYNKPHVGLVKIIASATTFTKTDKTWDFCMGNGIILRTEIDAKHMANYIRGYAAELQKIKASIDSPKNFGWKKDGSFVLGKYIVQPTGEIMVNPTIMQTIPVTADITFKGAIKEWSSLTKAFDNDDMNVYAFALLCGFAAPLFKFTGHGGVLVNLVGETGIGKSTVQRMINSIWGDPVSLMLAAKDTEASKLARMSYMNNLPVCIDEMGNLNGEAISSLLLKITQGMDTRRLKQDGTEREQREWNTIVITSSNHSFTGKLNTKKANSEAELMRLIELKAQPNAYFQNKNTATMLNTGLQKNHGFAGLFFIKILTKMQDKIPAMLASIYEEFKKKGVELYARERFWEATLAVTLLAGRITRACKLIQFDPNKVVYDVAKLLIAQRETITSHKLSPQDLVSLFASTNLNKTLYVDLRKNSVPRYVREPKGDDLAIRIETVTEPNGSITRAYMMISLWHFNNFLASLHEDYGAFKAEAQSQGYLIAEGKRNLGEGTIYSTPATKTFTLNLMHSALNSMFEGMQLVIASNVVQLNVNAK